METKKTEAQTYRHRVPKDAFEVQLYARFIREHLKTWPAYRSDLTQYCENGVWRLVVQMKDADLFDFDSNVMGRIYLAEEVYGEDKGRVAVIWEIGGYWNINTPPHLDLIDGTEEL
jgi:hypothetical protein